MATKTTKSNSDWIFDEEAVNSTKEKIKEKMGLHDYSSALEKLNDPKIKSDVIEKILKAELSDIQSFVDADHKDLKTILGSIIDRAASFGGDFDRLKQLNDVELAVIKQAEDALKEAEQELATSESMSDGWNILFGYKNRVVSKKTKLLEEAKVDMDEAKKKADLLYNNRLREANFNEDLQMFISVTKSAIEILHETANAAKEQAEVVEAQHKQAQNLFEQTAKRKNELETELKIQEEKLREANGETSNYVKGTEEAALHERKLSDIQKVYDTKRGEYDRMLAIHNSKERFVNILMTDMTALRRTESTNRSLAAQLKSDNEERVHHYQSVVTLIQSSKTQELSSAIEEVGVETDQKGVEIAVAITGAAIKDHHRRLELHPSRMGSIEGVMGALSEIITDSEQRLSKYKKMIEDGYGSNGTPQKGETTPTAESDLLSVSK